MSIRSVSLNEVVVSEKPTHIIVYNGDDSSVSDMKKHFDLMAAQISALVAKVGTLELKVAALDLNPAKYLARPSPFFGSSVAPELTGMEVQRLSVEVDPKETFKELVETMRVIHPSEQDKQIVGGLRRNLNPPVITGEDEAEAEAEAEEEEEAELEEEEEDDGEAVSLEMFQYNGITYYRDSENSVYKVDNDGDVDDTPIGVWNEAKQKIIKYKYYTSV